MVKDVGDVALALADGSANSEVIFTPHMSLTLREVEKVLRANGIQPMVNEKLEAPPKAKAAPRARRNIYHQNQLSVRQVQYEAWVTPEQMPKVQKEIRTIREVQGVSQDLAMVPATKQSGDSDANAGDKNGAVSRSSRGKGNSSAGEKPSGGWGDRFGKNGKPRKGPRPAVTPSPPKPPEAPLPRAAAETKLAEEAQEKKSAQDEEREDALKQKVRKTVPGPAAKPAAVPRPTRKPPATEGVSQEAPGTQPGTKGIKAKPVETHPLVRAEAPGERGRSKQGWKREPVVQNGPAGPEKPSRPLAKKPDRGVKAGSTSVGAASAPARRPVVKLMAATRPTTRAAVVTTGVLTSQPASGRRAEQVTYALHKLGQIDLAPPGQGGNYKQQAGRPTSQQAQQARARLHRLLITVNFRSPTGAADSVLLELRAKEAAKRAAAGEPASKATKK